MTCSGKPENEMRSGIYDSDDLALMHRAIEAVCAELGIEPTDIAAREVIAGHVMRSWSRGGRTPLSLVSAGLDGAGIFPHRSA